MKFYLKIGAIAIGILLLASLIIPFLIPKQFYINWAIGAIEARLPVKLSVVDANLRILPTPRIKLDTIDVEMKQEDGTFAEMLKAGSITLVAGLDFNFHRMGSLDNLEKLAIREATFIYPPGQKDAKKYIIKELVIDNIQLTAKTFQADIDLNGTHGKLTLAGDLDIEVTYEKQEDMMQGQAKLRSKSLTVLYSKDLHIRKQVFSLQTNFSHTPTISTLRNGQLQVGPQHISLTADSNKDGLTFDFQAEPAHIDFLKTIISALAVVPEMTGTNAKGQLQIPKVKGKPVRVEGTVTAESLKLDVYTFNEVSSDVSYGARKLQFSKVKAKVLDGSVGGDADLAFVKPQTVYNANLAARAIAVERIGDVGESLTGRAYLNIKVQGKGFKKTELEKHLSGSGDFEIKQLKLKKMKFFNPLMSLKQWSPLGLTTGLINREAFDKTKKMDEEAQNLTAQFTIGDAMIDFSEIRVNFPDAHVQLQGRIGFDESLDFHGTLNMSSGMASSLFASPSAQKSAGSEQGLTTIPLKVTGTTEHPNVGVDSNFMAGKLQGIAALPVRVLGGVLTLPLRLITPRSHQKAPAEETSNGEAGDVEEEAEAGEAAEPEEETEPKKSRSLGPAAGGGRRR